MSVEQLLNDLSMQLVMTSEESFAQSKDSIRETLVKIAELSKQQAGSPDLAVSCGFVISELINPSLKNAVGLLQEFASCAQAYLRDPHAKLPGIASAEAMQEDISPSLDQELLVEFIEKHTTMMEEFENSVTDLRYQLSLASGTEAIESLKAAFDRASKAYIHTVKGDAGSIGLVGVERASHYLEDLIVASRASHLLEALLYYKEWVCECMGALAGGDALRTSAAAAKQKFAELASESSETSLVEAPASAPAAKATPAANREDVSKMLGEELSADANLDLLAELLAEGVVSKPSIPEAKEPEVTQAVATEPVTQNVETYQITGEMDVFADFVVESEEHLTTVESMLLDAGGKYTKDNIDSLFRAIHSIKGASSYFNLKDTTETSHITETVLDEVRSGKRTLDSTLTEILLTYVDVQKTLFDRAKKAVNADGKVARVAEAATYLKRIHAYHEGKAPPAAPTAAPVGRPTKEASVPNQETAKPEGEDRAAKGDKLEVKNFIKIDTQRLDLLIDSIGEMCIYSSMLVQRCRDLVGEDEAISKTSHQVEKFSRELQSIGMSMRLIPIRGLFQKMSRLVWDTAKKIKKDVQFQMHGEDTELDRTIIDRLADPLMHMIRNAMDHGIELPDEREAKGKARQGTVTLSAAHQAGCIHITITDDGRGLDPDKLVKKAIEKGILSEHHNLTKPEIYNLIFAAGFSTAAVVTDLSGRGVGMDVVKRNIESMRGRVMIESELGKGSKFTIELPLTLAIMDGIEVEVGAERLLLPTLSVIEFMRPQASQLSSTLEKGETFYFRGRYLPIYRLGDLFGIPNAEQDPLKALFVVVESIGEQAVVMVDEIVGSQSTVIKGLGDMFDSGRGVAGCSIMASGDVALILDVRSLIDLARKYYDFGHRIDTNNVIAH